MSDALKAIEAKLDRADQSLRTLNGKLKRIEKAEALTISVKLDFKSGWHTCYLKKAEPLSPDLGVLIGESLYHGRSALEHLVWALVKANHKKPGHEHTFPIWDERPFLPGARDTADAFARITKKKQLKGVSKGALTLIESLQPYNRPDPLMSVLFVLNRMARDDRHRALHASFVGARDVPDLEDRFPPPRGTQILAFQTLLRGGKGVKPGTKIARFRLSRHRRYPQMGMKGGVPVFIAFGSSQATLLPLEEFQRINRLLRDHIQPFAEFL
ncbi:MAG: hypothetical protein ACYDHN_02470 [Solirubrobacteraceae bacterium]